MTKIKLYKNTQTKAYQIGECYKNRWSLHPYGDDTEYYNGYTEEEAEFILPDEFRIGETPDGGTAIFCGDEYCELITVRGQPRLVCRQTGDNGKALYRTEAAMAAAALGKKGGSVKSADKAAAVRENGKKGGRPKKARSS